MVEISETEGTKKSEERKIKRVEFNKDQKEELIEASKLLKKILINDKGSYIISCLETIPNNNFEPPMLEKLIKSLEYYYSRNITNMLLLPLINPPYVGYEMKAIIKDVEVNNFLDYLDFVTFQNSSLI